MPEYTDTHLARLVNADREDRAIEYVDALGTFPVPWRDRLIVLRCYVMICLESVKGGPDDLFAAKLSNYRKEFDAVLAQAKEAAVAGGATVDSSWPDLSAEVVR